MIEQINNLAQLWWDWTSAMFWQVGLLIVLIALLDRLIRRWAWPQLRYAMWSVILIKLVLSPALSSPSGLTPKLRPFVAQVLETTISRSTVEEEPPPTIPYLVDGVQLLTVPPDRHILLPVEGVPTVENSVGSDSPVQMAGPPLDWRVHAMSVWLLGMVTLGAWLLAKLRRLSREHPDKSGKATLPQSFHDQLAGCAEHLGLRRKPTPVVTNSIKTPAVFGLFRPVLLMPVGYIRNLSRKDTEYLLLHELAHIKRGDLVMHSLYMLLQLVYWYNPLLWLVRRRLRHLRELCCDATVADILRDRTVEYRRTLLEAARQFLVTPVEYGLGLVGLFEDSNFLIARIKWLEKPVWRHRKMKNATVVTMVLLLLVCVLPMAQAQQDSVPDTPDTGGAELSEDSSAEGVDKSQADQAQAQKLEQLMKAMQALQFQLQQLELQKQKLEHEIHAISHAEHLASHQTHQAKEHAAHVELKAKEAKDKAAKASVKAKEAKDTAAKAKTKAQTEHWQQWAKQMQQWAQRYQKWAESDEFKQWQKDLQQWAQNLSKFQTSVLSGSGDPAPEPGPMPVMPNMPPMPMPVAPAAPVPPDLVLPDVMDILDDLPMIGAYFSAADMALTPSAEEVPLGKPGREIEIKKDESGKYVATTLMHFVAKARPGRPLIVRNKVGGINLHPSKDSTCDVRARIRGTAKSLDQARAMVEAVSMKLESSDKRYYLEPVRRDGGKWDNLNVDLQITVPAGDLPDVKTDLGIVRMRTLKGSITAVTSHGGISAIKTTGEVELSSKMGSVEFIAPKGQSATISAGMFQEGAQGTIGADRDTIRMSTDMGSISLKWCSPAQDSPSLY
jgi:beta-lactamase regulating signal transducer with metallopeptidase domain